MMGNQLESSISGEITGKTHKLNQRIYYEDTDFSGIVYHARYLHFLERGRTDFLRLLGIHQNVLANEPTPITFAVSALNLNFLKPAKMDDIITIETTSMAISGARIVLDQKIAHDGNGLLAANVTIVALAKNGRPTRIPKPLITKLS